MEIMENNNRINIEEELQEEDLSCEYLRKYKFSKRLKSLNKKLQGKKIIVYGAGVFFEAMLKYYDLSELDIIGVADKKFKYHEENEKWRGFNVYAPDEILAQCPDYILVATKFYVRIIEDLHYNVLRGSKIKIKPFVKKGFFTLLKEVWE